MTDTLILTHGAGSNQDAPALVAVENAFRSVSLEVSRVNLPFRQARASGPPRAGDPERDRAGLRELVIQASGGSRRVYLGGHSYGGRQSTMLAAESPELISGLLLLSYPLHPPRKPAELRTAHFPHLRTPCLFVHGSRDPFGSVEEMRVAICAIPARTNLVEIDGVGHDLSRKGTGLAEVAARIAQEFQAFFGF